MSAALGTLARVLDAARRALLSDPATDRWWLAAGALQTDTKIAPANVVAFPSKPEAAR